MAEINRASTMIKVKQYTGVLLKGKTDYTCPACNIPNSFFLKQDEVCEHCQQILPNVKKLIENPLVRVSWHLQHPDTWSNP